MKKECAKCGKLFDKTGRFETSCKKCLYIQRRKNRRKNSIAKQKRRIFAIIRQSEWIHPKVRSAVIKEIKEGLKWK